MNIISFEDFLKKENAILIDVINTKIIFTRKNSNSVNIFQCFLMRKSC